MQIPFDRIAVDESDDLSVCSVLLPAVLVQEIGILFL